MQGSRRALAVLGWDAPQRVKCALCVMNGMAVYAANGWRPRGRQRVATTHGDARQSKARQGRATWTSTSQKSASDGSMVGGPCDG